MGEAGPCGGGLKAGAYDNELSRFRYDVTLHVGAKEVLVPPQRWLAWDKAGTWRGELEKALVLQPGSPVAVRGVHDARVAGSVEAVRLLHDPGSSLLDAAGLAAAAARVSGEDPDTVMGLVRRFGLGFCWQGFGTDGVYDAVFNPRMGERGGDGGSGGGVA